MKQTPEELVAMAVTISGFAFTVSFSSNRSTNLKNFNRHMKDNKVLWGVLCARADGAVAATYKRKEKK